MRRWFILLTAGLLLAGALPAGAQAGRPVITPDNAAQLTQVGLLGQGFFTHLQWSPDGKTLAAASSVGLWLYEAGHSAPRLVDQYGAVIDLAYQPGGTLLAAGQENQILLLDTTTWTPVQKLEGAGYEVAFSPDGKFLAAAGFGQVRLWDAAAGQVVDTWKNEDLLNCLVFDPSGNFLAGGNGHPKMTPRLYVWNVRTGAVVVEETMSDEIISLAFSPADPLLAVGGVYDDVQLWDFETRQRVRELDASKGADDLVFSPDGRSLFVAAGEVQAWDTTTYQKTVLLPPSESRRGSQALSPDRKTLANGAGGTVTWWDVDTGEEQAVFPGSANQDSRILFSPDSTLLASANLNGPLDLWDITTRTIRQQWEDRGVTALAFSPDSRTLAGPGHDFGSFTGPLSVWTVGSRQSSSYLSGSSYDIGDVRFSPDGKTLAVTAVLKPGKSVVLILDSATGSILEEWEPPCCYDFLWLSRFSSDGVEVFLRESFEPGGCALFYTQTGEIVPLPAGITPPLLFNPDGRMFAAKNETGQIEVWDARTWTSLLRLDTSLSFELTFNPAGTLLAVGSWDKGTVEVWDLASGKRLFQHTQADAVQDLAFSPDGTLLASAGKDGVIRLWGVP